MPQQGTSGEPPERRYDETVQPQNPPNAVVRPRVRLLSPATYPAALVTGAWYLGGLLVLLLIVGGIWIYTVGVDDRVDPGVIGTAGELPVTEPSPGGFESRPTLRTTDEELRYRGVGEPRGPLAPRATTEPLVGEREADD